MAWSRWPGVLRSEDGGRTWLNISAGLQNTAVTSLAFSPDGRWLYAGTVGGGNPGCPWASDRAGSERGALSP